LTVEINRDKKYFLCSGGNDKMNKKITSIILAVLICISTYIPINANEKQNDELNYYGVEQQSTRVDINDPTEYNLKKAGDELGWVLNGDNIQYLYFKGINNNGYSSMNVVLSSELKYNKAPIYKYANVEIYRKVGTRLVLYKTIKHNLWDYQNYTMNNIIPKADFSNQEHIYIRLGLYKNESDKSYGLTRRLRVDNPYKSDYVGHWAESNISEFISKGYIGGYSDGTFRPNSNITRAEFVKIVNNYFGLTRKSGKVFTDTKTHWAKNDIDIAVTNGVCSGITNTEFKPNDYITREQAAVMISNYKKISDKNYDKIAMFTDRYNISSWAKSGVEGVIEKGYMGGYLDGSFKPKNKITRAEAVSTLSRIK